MCMIKKLIHLNKAIRGQKFYKKIVEFNCIRIFIFCYKHSEKKMQLKSKEITLMQNENVDLNCTH